MESPVDLCFTEEGCSHDIVLEKQVFRSKVPESHVQLACNLHYCAFPLNGNELCIWNTGDSPAHHQPLHLVGHHHSITALAFGSKINPLLVCSASCDYVIVWNLDECTKKALQGKNEAILTELEGHLAPVTAAEFCTWERNMLISVSEDRSFKVWDYCTGLLIYQSAVLTGMVFFLCIVKKLMLTDSVLLLQLWIFSLLSGHQYRCVVHINLKKERDKFYSKTGKSRQQLDQIQKFSKLYLTNDRRPEETVETTLPVLRIEHCDQSINLGKEENLCLWIGSSTGLFIINLANFELEAVLHYKGECYIMVLSLQVFCLLTSMFENTIALLEINLAALMRSQQSDFLLCGKEKRKFSTKSSSYFNAGMKGTMKDQSLVFHSKIKSSGYTTAPQMTMFSPKTNLKKNNKISEWKSSCKRHTLLTTHKPVGNLFTGDGELLACGLADKSLLVFNSNLTGTPAVFSGHDGAINSVGWSHDKRWLVSASEDRTLRIWSVRNTEPALFLGKEMFHKSIRFAQFYYIDTFILLCCGAEFHLLSYYLDTSKDDLKRYKQKSICKSVQKFPMASTVEITSLSAINDFHSYIILAAGSNRTLEVFDLNAGCSAAVIPDAHSRSVHQICQNKGSAFSTQPLEAYNLFMTTATGDGIKLWDLRTLRCERRFEGHINRCHPCGIAVTPCGQFIACGSEDKSAYIYEMRSSTFSHKLAGHTESVINVAFSPSSPQVHFSPLSFFLSFKCIQAS
uniref:WD repeat domain 27 n=1 Tax=Terrapene triunguis TaxID=2587831 RepID=A0A674KAV6_9SAUR